MIEVKVLNWEKFNPRKDLKVMNWMRIEADIDIDLSMLGLNAPQKWAWVWILSTCAKKNRDSFRCTAEYLQSTIGIEKDDLDDVLETLQNEGMIEYSNNSIRNSKTNTRICPTSQNTGMMRLKRPFTSGGGAPGITQAAFFVGFIGLNDGGQNGSMDSFIAVP